MSRYARRKDTNHNDIIGILREVGPHGVTDLPRGCRRRQDPVVGETELHVREGESSDQQGHQCGHRGQAGPAHDEL